MHLTYTDPFQLTSGTRHHAFTSCASWRRVTYVAYRSAPTHHPFPTGQIVIRQSTEGDNFDTRCTKTFALPGLDADLRDPRLIATDDTLYCLVGAYLPKYPRSSVSIRSSENLIQSFLTYTEDGAAWAPLTPISRPNYWIWSAIPLKDQWVAAAYHTGDVGESSSIHLLFGASLLHLKPNGVIYDGASLEEDPSASATCLYPHSTVSEPVLYQPAPDVLCCAIRAEDGDKGMELGVSRFPYQSWRWHHTRQMIHPSAILPTPYGLLLAGRELFKYTSWELYTSLYHLHGQRLTRLARLPSSHDTGYPGLCTGADPSDVLCSFYSQHRTGGLYDTPLPGAHVFLTHLTLTS